jgi:hypothetical protein
MPPKKRTVALPISPSAMSPATIFVGLYIAARLPPRSQNLRNTPVSTQRQSSGLNALDQDRQYCQHVSTAGALEDTPGTRGPPPSGPVRS